MTLAITAPRQLRDRLLDRVARRLDGLLDAEHARWTALDPRAGVPIDEVAALVRAGGKRLRPAFCLSGFLAAGGDPDDDTVVDAAASLELVHTAALLHDDVLDAAELRRGRPTAHTRWTARHAMEGWRGEARRYGEGVATLAGDLAYAYAARLVLALPPAARPMWAELVSEVQIGQFLDVAVAAESVVDSELSRWIAVCKSGRYSIHRPLVLGALVAGRADLEPRFAAYGEALGEAFQLRDDLIDAFGETSVAGKPVGLDLEQHKMTLLLAEAARRDTRVRDLLTEPDWDVEAIRARLQEIDVRSWIERRIDDLCARACRSLDGPQLDDGWRGELRDMAREVAYRIR